MTQVRRFIDLRAPEVAERITERSIFVQPLGAIEQHGPHLPLSTDSLVATAVAEAAIAEVGEEVDAWLLPTLTYTKSNEHAWAPGTIWLSATTLLAVLDDIGRCLATTRAKRLVFLNGHGGNSALANVASRTAARARADDLPRSSGMPADQGGASPAGELGMGIHGGTDETSVVLHLAPELVRMDLAERRVPEKLAGNKYVRFGGRVSFGWLSNDFNPDGYIGDPLPADAELGKQLFEGNVRAFGEALREVATFDFGR
ncbi:MAG: creatininase family protein [Ilumatobacteraceae bacterium]